MVKINTTKNSYRITLESNKDVNVNDVYNRVFFSAFNIEGLRIFKYDTEEEIFVDGNNNDFDASKIIDVFGKEKNPNGYTTLPLKKEEKKEQSENDLYGMLNDYMSGYLPEYKDKNNGLNKIDVVIPLDINNPVITVDNLTLDNDELTSINNIIDYKNLEKIIHDLYIQINYFYDKGFFFKEILPSSVLLIQEKYMIFDSRSIDKITEGDKQKKQLMNSAILDFVKKLLKYKVSSSSIIDDLINIKDTNLYYFLKRIEYEGVLLWVY